MHGCGPRAEDADRRGLPALKPLLETLARSTAALREADRAVRDEAPVTDATSTGVPREPSARPRHTE